MQDKFQEDIASMVEDGVPVPLSKGRNAIVLPMGVVHVRKCQNAFMRLVAEIMSLPSGTLAKLDTPNAAAKAAMTPEQIAEADAAGMRATSAIVERVLPIASTELLDLIAACVVPPEGRTFNSLPLYDIPPIVEAWLELSFSAEKLSPWVAMLQAVGHRMTGLGLPSISGLLSRGSSPPDTASQASSTIDSLAARIAAGQCASSASGPSALKP